MSFRYAVVGAGMQGTAAAYDLALYGEAGSVLLADFSSSQAESAAARVNELLGREICSPAQLDVKDGSAVRELLEQVDLAVSAVPYQLHEYIERAAIEVGTNAVDMGHDTDVLLELLKLDEQAQNQGVTIVPDCGLAPGLVNSMALALMEEMEQVNWVKLYCGGLPANPKPPLNYSLRFSLEGLIGEYDEPVILLRDGEVQRIEPLTELEQVHFQDFGVMEAFATSGGTSTAPYTLKNLLPKYEYKTLRYPGHCEAMRLFRDCGFWSTEPLQLDGITVPPRKMFTRMLEPLLHDPSGSDVVLTRATAEGNLGGSPAVRTLDVIEYQDPKTGFTAMERLTGFCTSIIAIEVAHGRVRKGFVPYEEAVPGKVVLRELARRGIHARPH